MHSTPTPTCTLTYLPSTTWSQTLNLATQPGSALCLVRCPNPVSPKALSNNEHVKDFKNDAEALSLWWWWCCTARIHTKQGIFWIAHPFYKTQNDFTT
mmetsp:Transcript_11464/g.20697  ORF Transcript_11464/g.20697 Transcript_11464/m.20697 type:complete len:98 (+) Transcript_11464:136-429(+)